LLTFQPNNAVDSDSIAGKSSFLILERIVTIGSTIEIFFIPSSIARITRPAVGAQEPFSIIATLRF
jgi:hypothetical protein